MKMPELASRSWYYFRIGYYTYLSFLLGYGSTMVTIYYLAIKNIPELERVFSRFWLFAVLATAVGVPMGVVTGWVHTKRSSLWKAEIDIGAEANPYYYKLPPGYWREALVPAYLETLQLVRRLSERESLLNPDDKTKIEELEAKLRILVEGGYVGTPRRRLDL